MNKLQISENHRGEKGTRRLLPSSTPKSPSRLLFLMTVVSLPALLVLAACGGGPLPAESPPAAESVKATETPPMTITPPAENSPIAPSLTAAETSLAAADPTETKNPVTETPAAARPLSVQSPPLEGDDVREAQLRLIALGYTEAGIPDGIYSDQTQAATRHFQLLNRLPITGIINEETRLVLFSEDAHHFYGTHNFPGEIMSMDNTPFLDDYHALHNQLIYKGYLALEAGDDEWERNMFGPETLEAVKRFQDANGMTVNGIVDLQVWRQMFSPLSVKADGTIPVIPPEDPTWGTTIFPVKENPFALAYDGRFLWVACSSGHERWLNTVQAIDPQASLADISVPVMVGADGEVDNQIAQMVFVENTRKLWFLSPNTEPDTVFYKSREYVKDQPDVQSLDVETGLLYTIMPVGDCEKDGFCFGGASALGTDGRRLWASSHDQIWSINPTNGAAYAPRAVGWLTTGRMAFDGACLWMQGEAGAAVFHPDGGKCPGAEEAYALPADDFTFDGKRMWAAGGGILVPVDLSSGQIGDYISIGSGPNALDFDGQWLWVANAGGNSIQAVDVATGSVGEPLAVGERPVDILYDGSRVWVANAGSGTVQYIDPADYHIDIIIPTETPAPSTTPTLDATLAPTAPPFERQLSLASPNLTGDDVLLLQERLAELGYEVGTPDGVFGPMTDGAVRLFQQGNDLAVDGIVGALTWEALFSPEAQTP